MTLASINEEQGLYVMHAGDGFTCYGFEVLNRTARAVAAWSAALMPSAKPGTPEHFAECAAILEHGARFAAKTGTRCDADLTPQLVGLEGQRVAVVDCYGKARSFTVGKSTGWMPCHLEVKRRSRGGPAAMGTPYKSVRVVRR